MSKEWLYRNISGSNKPKGPTKDSLRGASKSKWKGVMTEAKSIPLRNRPFNLKGGGCYGFFEKNILIPNVAEKNNLIQSFCHIT